MTTIAYDGKTLAGDSAWSDNNLIVTLRTKIARLPSGCLYGCAGDTEDRDLVTLLSKVKKQSQLPSLADLQKIRVDLQALLIFPDGSAFQIECTNKPVEHDVACGVCPVDVPFAIGSGRELAIGAMDFGATAFEAVKVAVGRDPNSRAPVTRLALHPRHGVPKPTSQRKHPPKPA